MKISNSFERESILFFPSTRNVQLGLLCISSLSSVSFGIVKYIRPCSGTTYHRIRCKLRSSSVSVMFIFVSVYWDTLELNIWRIEIWIRIRIVKKCCRYNFVTWKLIFLVSRIVMLWCQCSKFLNLFRNRVSLYDVIIFYYVLFFLLFDIESLIQIRMICIHVIIPFIKTPVIVAFVKTPSIMNPWIISETYLYRF